jgi:hypothetical protein
MGQQKNPTLTFSGDRCARSQVAATLSSRREVKNVRHPILKAGLKTLLAITILGNFTGCTSVQSEAEPTTRTNAQAPSTPTTETTIERTAF